MKSWLLIWLLLLCVAFVGVPVQAGPPALYVAPHGHDDASGSQAAPLATLTGARDRIRALSAAKRLPKSGVIVRLRGGTYRLSDTFTLNAADDLSPLPVTYAAFGHEPVRLTGGQDVSGWKPVTDTAVLARLDPAARGHVLQADLKAQGITDYGTLTPRGFGRPITPAGLELFYNDMPMTLARWPNAGTWTAVAGKPSLHTDDHFSYDGDRPTRWANADDVWVHGYWTFDWADTYEKVSAIDIAKREIATAPPHGAFGYTSGHRWYALNLLEELDTPGEWYLDRKTGLLYLWPPSAIQMGRVTVSVTRDLVRLDHVSHVTLRGLTLEACRGTAVTITGGSGNTIDACTIRNTGNLGAAVSDTTGSGVQNCTLSETGDGGVDLSGGDRRTLVPGNNFVVNCRISRYSRWSRTYRPAVLVSGVGNRVAHCRIYDAPHNAILLSGNDHRIEYNEIHHVCLETGDAGAFYLGRDWTMRGTVVRFNYFHDLGGSVGVAGEFHDAMAVYLDDTAAGTTVYGNVCVRAGHAVMVGGGRDNIVANNIFVDCRPAVSIDARGLSWAAKYLVPGGGWDMQERLAAVPYDKPPYSERYPHLATILQDDPAAPKYNVIEHNIAFHCPNWLEFQDKEKTLPATTVRGNLADIDPLFVDAGRGNYQLKPNSPAYALGFRRIPFDEIGPR